MLVEEVTDEVLVTRARGGDRDAFRLLLEKYQRRAFVLALEIIKNREDAEDIVQESFVKAYLSLASFKGESSFYTWLYRIVFNMAIDYRRRLARHGGESSELDERTVAGEEAVAAGFVEGPQESVTRKQQHAAISRALGTLTPEHRAVVVLREIEGLNYDQIAEVAGVTKGTVMSRLHYARKKLQNALKEFSNLDVSVVNDGLAEAAESANTEPKAANDGFEAGRF
jgi:RNA polymerase sigma-70 factor, ECF subfamily